MALLIPYPGVKCRFAPPVSLYVPSLRAQHRNRAAQHEPRVAYHVLAVHAVLGHSFIVAMDRKAPGDAQIHVVVCAGVNAAAETPDSLECRPAIHCRGRRSDVTLFQHRNVGILVRGLVLQYLEEQSVGPYEIAMTGDQRALGVSLK